MGGVPGSWRPAAERAARHWAGLCELAGTLGTVRLVTATDGNHGRALARIAWLLGLGSQVFLPEVASEGSGRSPRRAPP